MLSSILQQTQQNKLILINNLIEIKAMKSLIIIGPSGVGKGTVIKQLIQKYKVFKFVMSYTTRGKRPNQVEGQHYYFIDQSQFIKKQKNNELLQAKQVFKNYYGTSKQSYLQIIQQNKIPLLDVDIEGMIDIRKSIKDQINKGVLLGKPQVLCILPPSWNILADRLKSRGTEKQQVYSQRMKQNKQQLQRMLNLDDQEIFYVKNYQYQLTVFGIELFLSNKFPIFHDNYWNQSYDLILKKKLNSQL